MSAIHDGLSDPQRFGRFERPDLCLFPNMALLHLGTGRGSLLVPKKWSARALRRLAQRADTLKTASLTAGPAFLMQLLRFTNAHEGFGDLKSITIGGAQTDCWIFEQGFKRWQDARWIHLYGGSEVEPVACVDARESVSKSQQRELFQALFIGGPVPIVEARPEADGLRVSGANVAKQLGATDEKTPFDPTKSYWHNMGDRIVADDEGWWYTGRVSQSENELNLEQQIYSLLGTSACFVSRVPGDRLVLFGEDINRRVAAVDQFASFFPEVEGLENVSIVRDRRHRARIDRKGTLAQTSFGRS